MAGFRGLRFRRCSTTDKKGLQIVQEITQDSELNTCQNSYDADMIHSKCLVWFISEMLLRFVQSSIPYVTWEAETRIIRLGETVVLTCTVHEIDAINLRETRQWSRESKLVCYNGQTTDPLKYMESLQRNKFKLFIYNVTEADLNCDYQCLYSFETFSQILEITTENFEYPPIAITNNTYLECKYNRSNSTLSIQLHMEKVFPLPNCTIVFEAFHLPFTGRTYMQNGLYFEVHLVHHSIIVFNKSTQLNITCQLFREYFIGTRNINIDEGDEDTDKHSMINYTIILIILAICIATIATIVFCIVRRKRRSADLKKTEKFQVLTTHDEIHHTTVMSITLRDVPSKRINDQDENDLFIESQNESKITHRKKSMDSKDF